MNTLRQAVQSYLAARCLLIMSHVVSASLLDALQSTCLCQTPTVHCIVRMYTKLSMRYRAKSGYAAQPPPTDRVYMIFDTDMPQKPCCDGTGMAKTLSAAYRFCQLTLGMFIRAIPTGISACARS